MKPSHRLQRLLLGSALLALTHPALAQTAPAPADRVTPAPTSPAPTLDEQFRSPPASARPRVWWHWMNGNISKDGIAKDLAWLKRVGIGGVQNFDADLSTPQIVDKRLIYMTPEWKDAFRFAVAEAERLGLEFAVAGSPGWSETGGPWVEPKDGIKKLVWTETVLRGGRRFAGTLAAPSPVTGPYQTMPLVEDETFGPAVPKKAPPNFYADVAVLAYPIGNATELKTPIVAYDGKPIDAAALVDAALDTAIEIPAAMPGSVRELQLTYPRPVRLRSARMFIPGNVPTFRDPKNMPVLQVRDGDGWRTIGSFRLRDIPTTISFAPETGREFRIVLGAYGGEARPSPMGDMAEGLNMPNLFPPLDPSAPLKIALLQLSGEAQVDEVEAKAGFTIARNYYALSKGLADAPGVAAAQVLDLTDRMRPDGSLDWTPPSGNWRVVRLGYSLTGKTNHPAPAEATGLEVDKLDGAAVRRYLDTYLKLYRDASGGRVGRGGIDALLTDSTEVGAFNWTPAFIAQFKRLRGYDPTPFLLTVTGAVIGSRAESDRFLFDFRRTIADLHADEHYGTLAAVAHENGLKVYGEALEDWRPSLGDDMAMRRFADYPMAAMWSWSRRDAPRKSLLGDLKGAASVAHIYGQNIAAAESLTAGFQPWQQAPGDLKRVIDLEFAYGINRPIIHTSVHQPVDDKQPGLALAPFIGQYFTRHESWAEMARPWIDYIARSSLMLQQGRNHADVAYFIGEEAPLSALFGLGPLQDTPKRYAYDFVNPDALLNQLNVDGGEIVAKSGARYRLLYLGGSSRRLTVQTLQKLAELAEAGATIVGNAPEASPSLAGNAAEFDSLVRRLWSDQPETIVGRGRVIAGGDVEAALAQIGVAPDFALTGAQADSEILFVHRTSDDGDIYFVNNRRDRAEQVEARFRISGKQPELWRAETGTGEAVSYRIEGDTTIVPLNLASEESVFLVFRKPAQAASLTLPQQPLQPVAEIAGPWRVTFQKDRGAPDATTLSTLGSLSEDADPAIRYFSGVATYSRDIQVPRSHRTGSPLWLDLGRVGDIAEVRVNGQLVGTAWHAPFRVDIGKTVRRGTNHVEVSVANVWANRLIGDAQPGAKQVGWIAMPMYKPDAPLRPSGLIGPVRLLAPGQP